MEKKDEKNAPAVVYLNDPYFSFHTPLPSFHTSLSHTFTYAAAAISFNLLFYKTRLLTKYRSTIMMPRVTRSSSLYRSTIHIASRISLKICIYLEIIILPKTSFMNREYIFAKRVASRITFKRHSANCIFKLKSIMAASIYQISQIWTICNNERCISFGSVYRSAPFLFPWSRKHILLVLKLYDLILRYTLKLNWRKCRRRDIIKNQGESVMKGEKKKEKKKDSVDVAYYKI